MTVQIDGTLGINAIQAPAKIALVTTTVKLAISPAVAGMIVYDSTLNKLCVYTGAAWQTVTST